ncbi:MAG: ATP-binding protein [Deltaproteobacteria bacterium]
MAHAEQPLSVDAQQAWLAECAVREAAVDKTARADFWPLVRMQLTATQERVMWTLIAQELDPAARMQLRELATEDDSDVNQDVLRRIVYGHRPDEAGFRDLSSRSPLLQACLIEPLDEEDVPAHRRTYRIARRVLALAHGIHDAEEELTGYVETPSMMPRLDQLTVGADALARVRAAVGSSNGLVIVTGSSGAGKRSVVVAAARERGANVIAVDCAELDRELVRADRQLRILARECKLWDCVPLLLNLELLAPNDERPDRVKLVEALARDVPVLATARHPIARRWRSLPGVIELPPLNGAERAVLWKRALPEASDGDAELLSTLYPLAPALVASVATTARVEARGEAIEPRHISLGLRHVLDDRLAGLGTRVTVTQSWEDLVLPDDQTMAVVELLARIRARRLVYEDWGFAKKLGRGLGVAAMFSGPPGTGKTMCAGLIAKDLGTELYQVDLGKIVSKWVGETEKNLGALFDAAEASHAVLLFDEADSLFGKRTSVTSTNDRYANQETNFLLQRIEAFTGICILTTNHDPAIDEAFLRRLAVRVRFPLPDEDERERLWRAMIPTSAPTDDKLDLASLAKKYVMAGGNIRNAVLRAAFLAADAKKPIGYEQLRQAAHLEYEAMGKLV